LSTCLPFSFVYYDYFRIGSVEATGFLSLKTVNTGRVALSVCLG
jgi:hypothetical protein